MNRTQGVVLGFFALVWVSRVVILVVAPEVYDQALRLSGAEVPSSPFWRRSPGCRLLVVGVMRCWRWTFWLILVALLFGVLRVAVAVLQLTGSWPWIRQSGTCCIRACSAWPSSASRWP